MMGTGNESLSDLVSPKNRLTDFDHFFPKWQRLEKIISENKFPNSLFFQHKSLETISFKCILSRKKKIEIIFGSKGLKRGFI